jgi:hypothetical protein
MGQLANGQPCARLIRRPGQHQIARASPESRAAIHCGNDQTEPLCFSRTDHAARASCACCGTASRPQTKTIQIRVKERQHLRLIHQRDFGMATIILGSLCGRPWTNISHSILERAPCLDVHVASRPVSSSLTFVLALANCIQSFSKSHTSHSL